MSPAFVRRVDGGCAALLVAYVLWVCAAYPWLQDVGCLRGGPLSLRRLTIIAELGIFVPYTWMPVSLMVTWRAARTRPGAVLLALYGAFIILCGGGHLLRALGVPWADYALDGAPGPTRLYWLSMKVDTITAAVSLAVARMTDRQRGALLALSDQQGELVRQRDEALASRRRARQQTKRANRQTALAEARAIELDAARAKEAEHAAEARQQAENAVRARAELARANEELERRRAAESERARTQTARAQTAEAQTAEYQRMLEEIEISNLKIAAQGEALRGLPAPILQPLDRTLLSVLIGTIDSAGASDWTERLLEQVAKTRSKLVIFDLTALRFVDSKVAQAIIKTANGVELLGAKRLVTGMQPTIAQTIVNQGIDLSSIEALPTLQEAIMRTIARRRA